MSSHDPEAASDYPRSERDSRSDAGTSYSIGYGRPPRKHQFQPGHSGNPKGRPKGTKNTATLVREILDRKIEVRSGGTPRKVTVREGILTGFAQASLKGDTKSAAFLLQRYDMPEGAQEHASDTHSGGAGDPRCIR